MNDKDMIERYIYEVIRQVSQESRKEIRMELQALIEDMTTEENLTTEEVLTKLGNPAEFAKRYKDSPNYLIGPGYYDNYIWVLKIALIGIGISSVIAAIVQGIMDASGWTDFFSDFLTELFVTAFSSCFSVIGIVTIIFAVLEWQKIKISLKPKTNWTVNELSKNAASVKSWTPSALPPIPDKRAIISRGDSIISIIFITVFGALLLFAPQLFSAFHHDGNKIVNISCIFNLEEWHRILPVILFSFAIGLIDEIIALVTGYYCKAVMYSKIICNAIQIACTVILLKVLPLWNLNFMKDIQAVSGKNKYTESAILNFWGTDTFNNIALAIICLFVCIEVAVTLYKTQKYN